MRGKKALVFFSGFFFHCAVFSGPLHVHVDAESAILINAETGAILYQKNADQPMHPASLTKIATALYAIERGKDRLDNLVLVSYDMVRSAPQSLKKQYPDKHPPYRQEPDGTKIGLQAGEEMALHTLLQGILMCSGNDAANAVASYISGDVEHFMHDLNTYLRQHHIQQSYFLNPHGLEHEQQKTTAHDLARITMMAMKEPIFREIVRSTKIAKPATNKQPASFFVQANRLLKPGQFYYPKAIGVKTGYFSKAGFNLVAAAEDKDRQLIAVLLKDKDSASRYRDAINLFEAAFHETKVDRTLFAEGQDVFRLDLSNAKKPVEAVLKQNLTLSYYPSEEPQIKARVVWKQIELPIQKEMLVGEVVISTKDDLPLMSAPIYAVQSVDKTSWAKVTDWMRDKKMTLFHYRLSIIIGLALFTLFLSLMLRMRKEGHSAKDQDKP